MTPPEVPPYRSAQNSSGRPSSSGRVPTRRERFRPLELLGLSGVVAGFIGLIVLMSTRDGQLAVIAGGLAFIVSLMVFAALALAVKPTGDERADLDEQNRPTHH